MILRRILAAWTIVLVSSQALAWSDAGHKIIASIAFARLTPMMAHLRRREILGDKDMERIVLSETICERRYRIAATKDITN